MRTTCNGPVGGAASSDSIHFCSNFVSFRLICPFVFSWSILTLSSSTSTCLPSGFMWSPMSVPIVSPGSGVCFFFRPFFGVPASDPAFGIGGLRLVHCSRKTIMAFYISAPKVCNACFSTQNWFQTVAGIYDNAQRKCGHRGAIFRRKQSPISKNKFLCGKPLSKCVEKRQLQFLPFRNAARLENSALWFFSSGECFGFAVSATGARCWPRKQTRTVLYSRNAVRVYMHYMYISAVL